MFIRGSVSVLYCKTQHVDLLYLVDRWCCTRVIMWENDLIMEIKLLSYCYHTLLGNFLNTQKCNETITCKHAFSFG